MMDSTTVDGWFSSFETHDETEMSYTTHNMWSFNVSSYNASLYASTNKPPLIKKLLVWQDYLVFAISLSLPLMIGLFFFITRYKKKDSAEDFLVGERSINFIAVAFSLLGSLLNGIFVIGTPSEVRYFGAKVIYSIPGLLLAATITSIFFIPTFQGMKFTSAYEYIEKRYNFPTRIIASLTFIVSVVLYLAVVLFVPALAFSQVTGVSHYIIIAVAGVVCTIYTAMGGIRAVVYTDALQMIILLIGLIVICVLGSNNVGGGQQVWEIARRTGRINFAPKQNAFNPDPRARHTFWTQVLGIGSTNAALFLCNQMMIQRYMAVDTPMKAQASLMLTWLALVPMTALGILLGLVMNATYESDAVRCDPLIAKQIQSGDQIVPFFIMQILGDYTGVPGLLMAAMFSAALSSIASVVNALSAVFLVDIITPIVSVTRKKPLSESARKKVAVIIVVFFGLLTVALSFAADKFTSKIIQATGTIWGVIDGPLAGIFIAGFFIPFCNAAGAIAGIFGGLILALWISLGGIIYAPPPNMLPISSCNGNMTISLPLPSNSSNWFPLLELYKVTYGWYGVIGIFSSLIINIIVSLISSAIMELCVRRGWTLSRIQKIPPSLMYSCADNVYCYCPESCKKPYRCGVDYEKSEIVNGEAVEVLKKEGIDNKHFTDDTPDYEEKSDSAKF